MRVLVVNSTQHKHPFGAQPWVRASLAAVESLAREGHSFVASLGTAPWELVLWKIASVGAPVHVLCPVPRGTTQEQARTSTVSEFGLRPELCTWQFLTSRSRGRPKDTWPERDLLAFRSAERIAPISIRQNGRLDALLRQASSPIDSRFRVGFDPVVRPPAWSLPAAPHGSPAGTPDLLLHFTRASDGPWAGETRSAYYEAVACSSDRYARDGFATLHRIAREKRIRGSSFRMRGGARTVSWTASTLTDALSLVRWRSRFARYAFEPYAIAIPCSVAREAGARPVIYDGGAGADADPLRQGRGESGHWEAEREWRSPGDVDLGSLDERQVLLLTPSEAEAAQLRGHTGFAVRALGGPHWQG